MSDQTGPCGKCESEISVTADRCPECGYEPGNQGILSSIASILALIGSLLGGLFLLAVIGVGITGGYSIGTFIFAVGLAVGFTIIPVGFLYGVYKKSKLTAAKDEL